jgi:hypothetical protein
MKHTHIAAAATLVAAAAQAAPNSVVCSDDKFDFTLVSSAVFDANGGLKANLKDNDRSTGLLEIHNRANGLRAPATAVVMVLKDRWVVFGVGAGDLRTKGTLELQVLLQDDGATGSYGINSHLLQTPNKLTCLKGS